MILQTRAAEYFRLWQWGAEWRVPRARTQEQGPPFWELSKIFNRESLRGGVNELYKWNVKGKAYKLLYELNKHQWLTPSGGSNGWGQGKIEGTICSAINLDKGVGTFSLPVNMILCFLQLYSELMFLGCVKTHSLPRWEMILWDKHNNGKLPYDWWYYHSTGNIGDCSIF